MIYLATPYSHPDPSKQQARYDEINRVAGWLMRKGFIVFSPVTHSHPIEGVCDGCSGWEFWQVQDFAVLARCDALVVYCAPGWQKSVGVTAEVNFALQHDMPVMYIHPSEVLVNEKTTAL